MALRGHRWSLVGLPRRRRHGSLRRVRRRRTVSRRCRWGRRAAFARAIAAYDEALARARDGLAPESPAIRALAVGGNGLAATLEDKPDRSPPETEAMIAAAEGALAYWRKAGTWLEEERAYYRLTRSQLAAGRPHDAIGSAQGCIAVCAANDAPAFELFFERGARASQHAARDPAGFAASRARALEQHALVPSDERVWCEKELKEMDALA